MIRKNRDRSRQRSSDSDNPYWVSFSDLMAGLLIIFILALITLMIDQRTKAENLSDAIEQTDVARQAARQAEDKAKQAQDRAKEAADRNEVITKTIAKGIQELSESEKKRIQIITEIEKELNQQGIKVEVSKNTTALHIPEDTLAFETGKWDVPKPSFTSLRKVGDVLKRVITKDEYRPYIDTIFVEGHTDSIPLERDMGNWGLSTYRAISVWNFWGKQDTDCRELDILENFRGEPIFSVSGYGDKRRLIEIDETPEDQRKNRRIDIRFTMKSIDQTSLEKVISEALKK